MGPPGAFSTAAVEHRAHHGDRAGPTHRCRSTVAQARSTPRVDAERQPDLRRRWFSTVSTACYDYYGPTHGSGSLEAPAHRPAWGRPAPPSGRTSRVADPRGRMLTPESSRAAHDRPPVLRRNRQVKFRVDRDVLADAVAWAARSLPVRPSVPVLAGLLIEASDDGLVLSTFDYETSARATLNADVSDEGRALVSGRLLADICRSLPAKPVEMTLDGARVTPDLRLGAVQPADDAGRGLPDAARHARGDRHRLQRRLRPRRRPGRHRRRSRRHAARADRRPDRDRGLVDLDAGHRPVPALPARAGPGSPHSPDESLGRAGPGPGARRHRQVADRRAARSRSRWPPVGSRRGHHRLRGLGRRRHPPYDDPAARRRVPQGPQPVPQRAPDHGDGRQGRADRVAQAGRAGRRAQHRRPARLQRRHADPRRRLRRRGAGQRVDRGDHRRRRHHHRLQPAVPARRPPGHRRGRSSSWRSPRRPSRSSSVVRWGTVARCDGAAPQARTPASATC